MVARRITTVCHVLHSLNVGGAEMLAARLAQRLRGSFRFVFACLDELGLLGEQLQADGFKIVRLDRQAGFDWRCSLRLARLVQSERIDVIHAHQYGPFLYAMTSRLSGVHRRPILFTEHGRHQPDYPRRKRMIANRLLLSRRDRVVGVGDAVREALIANEGFSRSRVEVVCNGIDVAKFSAANDRPEARRALQAADHEFVILQVARLDYLKDHGTALRTLARVLKTVPSARLVLVGEGPERSAIDQRVKELRLGDAVRCLGTRTDVHRLLPGADVFLLTSLSEGFPLTVLEAMAARLPVVGTDVGGMREVVVDGATGYLCRARDDVSLADRIAKIAGDEELRRRLGAAGYVRAAERFDESRMCSEYERHYRELGAFDNAIRPSSPRLTRTSPWAASTS